MGSTKKRKRKTPSSRRRRCEDKWRDWAWLPQDIVRIILTRLRQTDILGGVVLVCSPWRRLALEEPLLWRRIDLSYSKMRRSHERPHAERRRRIVLLGSGTCPHPGWKSMALAAVDRSAGQCESFKGHVDADVLVHLANSAPLLKCLHATGWPIIPDKQLITKIIRKLPLLERVVLCGGKFEEELLVALLDHCPRLELLDASLSVPTFRIWEEPIATRIWKGHSTIKDFRMPHLVLL